MKKFLLTIPLLFLVSCGGDGNVTTPDYKHIIDDNTTRIEKLESLENSIDTLKDSIVNIEDFLDINTYNTFNDLILSLDIYNYSGNLTDLQSILDSIVSSIEDVSGASIVSTCTGSTDLYFKQGNKYIRVYKEGNDNSNGSLKMETINSLPSNCEV